MAVGGGLAIDGTQQIETLDDPRRTQIENIPDTAFELRLLHFACSVGLHHDGDRLHHTDGVGDLDRHPVRHSGGHQVLGDPAGGIGGRTVHFRRIFPAEGSAAVGTAAAVGIDDDLAPRQSRISLGAADDETAGRVDVVDDILGDQFFGDHGMDHLLQYIPVQLLLLHLRCMLGGDDHGGHLHRLAVTIPDAHLGFAVGTQIGERPVLADLGQSRRDLVGQGNRQRHQLLRLPTGIAEHQPLIPRTGLAGGLVDPLIDIGALLADSVEDSRAAVVETEAGVGVADLADHLSGDILHGSVGVGLELSGDDTVAVAQQRFAGDPRRFVVFDDIVQNRVADLIRHLVGMPFGDRFTGKNVLFGHSVSSLLS